MRRVVLAAGGGSIPSSVELTADPAIRAVAAALREGGAVVFPTETFYALGADPRSAIGTARVFQLKQRPLDRPLPWIAASLEQVESVCRLPAAARLLARRYWPGPLTLVLPRRESHGGTAAVRVSSHPAAQALAAALGHPVISTSANRSGRPPAVTVAEAARSLGPAAAAVTALDDGPTPGGAPSVIVEAGDAGTRVLRGALETLEVSRPPAGKTGSGPPFPPH